MMRRNAVAISIVFHAVLLTLLVFYLVVWDRPSSPQPDLKASVPLDGRIVSDLDEPPTPPEVDIDSLRVEPIPDEAMLALEAPPNPTNGLEPESAVSPARTLSPVRRIEPVYPVDAIEDDVSGRVEAILTIDANGDVIDVEILSATPRGYFERETRRALRRWKYEPDLVSEISTGATRQARVEIVFNLEDVKRDRWR